MVSTKRNAQEFTFEHGEIILNRSNNSQIFIETPAPQQAGGFIIKRWLSSKQSMSNHFSLCQDMLFLLAFP